MVKQPQLQWIEDDVTSTDTEHLLLETQKPKIDQAQGLK